MPRALARSAVGGQGFEVVEGVGDLEGHDAAVPAQAGDPVGALDQAGRDAQGPPQLVLDLDDVAAAGRRSVGGVDRAADQAQEHSMAAATTSSSSSSRAEMSSDSAGVSRVGGDGGGPVEDAADRRPRTAARGC